MNYKSSTFIFNRATKFSIPLNKTIYRIERRVFIFDSQAINNSTTNSKLKLKRYFHANIARMWKGTKSRVRCTFTSSSKIFAQEVRCSCTSRIINILASRQLTFRRLQYSRNYCVNLHARQRKRTLNLKIIACEPHNVASVRKRSINQ